MNKTLKKELLRIIHEREDFDSIISRQISYPKISEELINLSNEKYITNTESGIVLTEKGIQFLNENRYEKILELEDYKINDKLRIDEFYMPEYIKGVIKELKN